VIEISEATNANLYYDFKKCLAFCKSIPECELTTEVEFHAFWDGEFGRKQLLPIKSFFATQNTKYARFNLWSRQNLKEHPLLQPYAKKIKFRTWDPFEEAKGTILQDHFAINSTDSKHWIDGDIFRLLCLHKYGGVYIDMDIVLLRDFAPLLQQEFMYKWGTERNMINGAVMHMHKNSKLSTMLLEELKRRTPVPNSTSWGNDVYVAVWEKFKNWTIFPAAFFNTEWQLTSEFFVEFGFDPNRPWLEPFKKCNQSNHLYEGAFSWHWHGRWNEEIQQGSKWQILEEKIEKILNERSFK
jgi:hypothetical protein